MDPALSTVVGLRRDKAEAFSGIKRFPRKTGNNG
jgi:hypothetical protein